jgi:sialate O-acetylesterase
MNQVRRLLPLLSTVFLVCSGIVFGEISLPAIISDHMVLQQGKTLPIWGWGETGEAVTIRIGSQIQKTVVGEDGTWKAYLDPLSPVNESLVLTVQGQNTLTVEDVLVGEVWLASGQSNMQFSVGATDSAVVEVTAADYPSMRLFSVPKNSSLTPVEKIEGTWQVCRPDSVAGFSAVAYFFGRELHRRLEVPVGMIASSWGGTNAEEWTDMEWLLGEESLQPILDRWQETSESIKALYEPPSPVELLLDEVRLNPENPEAEPLVVDDFEDGDLVTLLFGGWGSRRNNGKTEGLTLKAPGYGGTGQALRFESDFRVGISPSLRLNYSPGRQIDLAKYRSISFAVRGKGFLRFRSLQPTVTDSDNYTYKQIPLTESWEMIEIPFSELHQAGWGKQQPFTAQSLSGALFEVVPVGGPITRPPGGLYNGMIQPLIPFSIRGAIWYQGEGNAGRAEQYQELLPTMIRSWRRAWAQDEFPFLVAQLPNYKARRKVPGESAWAELRDAQLNAAKGMQNVGLAVTIELGEADDVHPRSKQEVGRRLALLALGETYDEEKGGYSGPIFDSMTIEENKVHISFKYTGTGLIAAGGQSLRGFAIAGADQEFHWANAKIEDDVVVVWSDAVPSPVAVRYAWADNPDCNLYNKEGLPASPFKTDDWPGITSGRK